MADKKKETPVEKLSSVFGGLTGSAVSAMKKRKAEIDKASKN